MVVASSSTPAREQQPPLGGHRRERPPIEACMQFARTRLSDIVHRSHAQPSGRPGQLLRHVPVRSVELLRRAAVTVAAKVVRTGRRTVPRLPRAPTATPRPSSWPSPDCGRYPASHERAPSTPVVAIWTAEPCPKSSPTAPRRTSPGRQHRSSPLTAVVGAGSALMGSVARRTPCRHAGLRYQGRTRQGRQLDADPAGPCGEALHLEPWRATGPADTHPHLARDGGLLLERSAASRRGATSRLLHPICCVAKAAVTGCRSAYCAEKVIGCRRLDHEIECRPVRSSRMCETLHSLHEAGQRRHDTTYYNDARVDNR